MGTRPKPSQVQRYDQWMYMVHYLFSVGHIANDKIFMVKLALTRLIIIPVQVWLTHLYILIINTAVNCGPLMNSTSIDFQYNSTLEGSELTFLCLTSDSHSQTFVAVCQRVEVGILIQCLIVLLLHKI